MSEFLRGDEEQKYGGFDDDDEEGSIRDYQNDEDEDVNGEEAHGFNLMVVGKAMKI